MSFSYFLNNPRSLKIVELDDNHKFVLNESNLKSILFHRKARNKPVCVISIAGAFRKGKSFLLNFFIRFFQNGGRDGWLLNEYDQLKGFHWRGGSDRDTTGIFMWSEPFVLRTVSNEEVAVLLMDTQGSFDSSSTIKDCASLFALSLMTSSMQIYNISQNIQEDDLQNLHLFSDYGRLALESTSKIPFQSLILLVRDWPYDYEYEYGFDGGQEFFAKRFNSKIDKNEIKETRNFIRNCFKDLSCFLMPHPGLKASTSPYFDGKLADIDVLFRVQVVNFIESLFQEKMFQIKEINGSKVTATELFEYFKIYCMAFQDNRMPNPNSLLKATAEANNLAAKAMAKEFYNKQMELIIFKEKSFISPENIEKIHMDTKLKSIKFFESIKKMGGVETSRIYLKELIFELDELLSKYFAHNQMKKSTESLKTPFTLLSLVFINYILAGFFSFIWMSFFAYMFKLGLYLSLFTVLFWSYSKYTRQNSDIVGLVDTACSFLWENLIQIIGGRFLASLLSMLVNSIKNFGSDNFFFNEIKMINIEKMNKKSVTDKGDCL